MSSRGQRMSRLAEQATGARSPRVALRSLRSLRDEIDDLERQEVARALTAGASFATIARDLGVSRQAAHRRFRALVAAGEGPRPTPEARLVLEYAREEAAALGAAPGGAHLVLGVVRMDGVPASAVLAAAGALAETARRAVGTPSSNGRYGGDGLEAIVAAAIAEAARRGDREVEAEHLLLAALEEQRGSAPALLERLGIDAAAVRAALAARIEPWLS